MKECLPHMAMQTPFCTKRKGLGHGHRAVCCLHHGVHTSNSAVHMLPEVYYKRENSKFEWRVKLKREKLRVPQGHKYFGNCCLQCCDWIT